jgi:hypothetical protein
MTRSRFLAATERSWFESRSTSAFAATTPTIPADARSRISDRRFNPVKMIRGS